MGILNFRNPDETGENHLISVWLARFLDRNDVENPLFLDVGANKGDYATMLLDEYPEARLLAFEPNPHAFKQCREILGSYPRARVKNVAVGAENSEMELHIPEDEERSSHSSLYAEVLDEQHDTDFYSYAVDVQTIDDLIDEENDIHFAKIDTEGHEYDVLEGAMNAIESGKMWSIQFEFNEMNVASRVFLRDYFQLLEHYNFYRLLPDSLSPLEYDPKQEIFKYQNILAVHKSKDIDLQQKIST